MAKSPERIELVLSCRSWHEAQAVADSLQAEGLVGSVEFLRTGAHHWWQLYEPANEVKLILETVASNIPAVKKTISRQFGRRNYALQQLSPIPAGMPKSKSKQTRASRHSRLDRESSTIREFP